MAARALPGKAMAIFIARRLLVIPPLLLAAIWAGFVLVCCLRNWVMQPSVCNRDN